MGKARKSKKAAPGGPYLDSALICEQALWEKKDSALSLIRLVNRLTIEGPFEPGQNYALPLHLFVSFKAGGVEGKMKLSLYLITPSGKRLPFPGASQVVLPFEGGDTGVAAAWPPLNLMMWSLRGIFFPVGNRTTNRNFRLPFTSPDLKDTNAWSGTLTRSPGS